MFVSCKKALEFSDSADKTFIIPKDFIGDVPEWVEATWLFKAACKDGTITFIGRESTIGKQSDTELQTLREQAKALGIKNYQAMKTETLKEKISEIEANAGDVEPVE